MVMSSGRKLHYHLIVPFQFKFRRANHLPRSDFARVGEQSQLLSLKVPVELGRVVSFVVRKDTDRTFLLHLFAMIDAKG